jgi:putative phage-type endonuclease
MTAYQLLAHSEVDTPEWHETRSRGLGGSDASAILGINPYRSPYDVWAEKTGKVRAEGGGASEAAYWGTTLEPILASELQHRLGTELSGGIYLRPAEGTLRSVEHPFMIANVDRMVFDTDVPPVAEAIEPVAVAEIKTVGLRGAADWRYGGIGKHALVQGVHYMAVTGLEVCYFGCLIGGQEFVWRALERDADLEADVIQAEEEFWRLVTEDHPPLIDGSPSTKQTLLRMYPEAVADKTVDLGPAAAALIATHNRIKDEVGLNEQSLAAVDNALKAALGEAEVGLLHGRPAVKWSNVAGRRSIDTKRLRAEHPDIAAKYTITGESSRRLSIV